MDKNDTAGISNSLIGYLDKPGGIELIRPLIGTPDITFYVVCTDMTAEGVAHASWSPAMLRPSSVGHNFRFQSQGSGTSTIGHRIDTSAQTNHTRYTPDVRVEGRDFIAWITATDNGTQVATGANSAAVHSAHSATTLSAHDGWEFSQLSAGGSDYCNRSGALVFDAAHSESTRQAVIDWLAEQYDADL